VSVTGVFHLSSLSGRVWVSCLIATKKKKEKKKKRYDT